MRKAVRSSFAGKRLALGLLAVLVGGACNSASPSPSPGPSASPRVSHAPTPRASVTPVPGPSSPLRALDGKRYFGTAVLTPWIFTQPEYIDMTASEFDSVTPEKDMNWAAVEQTKGEPDWSAGDAIVEWAVRRSLPIRAGGLVWDQGLPAWLTTTTATATAQLSSTDLATLLQGHVAAEVGHFAGKVSAWDVVTDPFTVDGSLRKTIWEKAIGPDYIERALVWAHTADPKAKLYINESGAEGLNPKSDALYDLVKTLLAKSVPIDGVGFEAHLDGTTASLSQGVAANLQRFGALGLDVAITQLDVRVHVPALEGETDRQQSDYVQMVSACYQTPRCVGITLWEWSDRYSWIPGAFPSYGTADLWDANFNPKTVLAAVKAAMQGQR